MQLPGFYADGALHPTVSPYRGGSMLFSLGDIRAASYGVRGAVAVRRAAAGRSSAGVHCSAEHHEFCEGYCWAMGGGMASSPDGGVWCYL